MPDLSSLKPHKGNLLLRIVFAQADTNIGYKAPLFRRIFIRLIDKAIYEYSSARIAIINQVQEPKRPNEQIQETGRIIYMFSFTDHIENCLNAIRRLFWLLERINNDKNAPMIPKDKRKFLLSHAKNFIDIRNAIEHIDELIQKNEIGTDESIMIALSKNSDKIKIGQYEITFIELAEVIKRLHELSSFLIFNSITEEV